MPEPPSSRERRRAGFVSAWQVVALLLVFAGYTVWCFRDLSFEHRRIERGLAKEIATIGYDGDPQQITARIVRRVSTSRVPLDPEWVQVSKEAPTGQRILRIAVDYPIIVRYLGRELTYWKHSEVETVQEVDEEFLARVAEEERRRRAAARRRQEIGAIQQRKVDAALADCERIHGRGGCRVFEVPGRSGDPIRAY